MAQAKLPGTPSAVTDDEEKVSSALQRQIRKLLNSTITSNDREDRMRAEIERSLRKIGCFYRTESGAPLFFRNRNRRLYEISTTPESDFAKYLTYLGDLSARTGAISRCLDRIRARVAESAQFVTVHALAFDSPDGDVIAVNDFAGGMWRRRRGPGASREWKPNGTDGVVFWTPSGFVDSWKPEFSRDSASDEDQLRWFVEQPHFADDVLSVRDQRLLFRSLLLSLFFPSRCRVRPVHAHVGLGQGQQHDTGKTMAGKIMGILLTGPQFTPTPCPESSERGEEAIQLALMNEPFVLLDNVDTDIKWLSDFLCTYATGARPTRRKLYSDTDQVHIEYRGRLCVTSRKAKFNRDDVASRTIPFRFKPIAATERKTETELLNPVIERRGRLWAGLLTLIGRMQDALPTLSPPSATLRLADFEQFGWLVAKVEGEEKEWEAAMVRLESAQAGFALDDEPLFRILEHLLGHGDPPEQLTSQFWKQVKKMAAELGLPAPTDAASCTKRINDHRRLLQARLDITIKTRTLNGQTLIQVGRGPSWAPGEGDQVTEVTDLGGLLSGKEIGEMEGRTGTGSPGSLLSARAGACDSQSFQERQVPAADVLEPMRFLNAAVLRLDEGTLKHSRTGRLGAADPAGHPGRSRRLVWPSRKPAKLYAHDYSRDRA